MSEHLQHTLPPWFNSSSRVLILGSFPSPKSRAQGLYYGHPQNRFWTVLASLLNASVPKGAADCKAFALQNGIALWDVISQCDIQGASDASIRNVIPNDLNVILNQVDIRAIYTTGRTATDLFAHHIAPELKWDSIYLPSTSPANRGRWPLSRLLEAYAVLLPHLK